MARGIKDKVAILGMGCSKFGERWDSGAEELMLEAYRECLADAGIDQNQLQAAWFSTAIDEVHVGKSGIPLSTTLRLPNIPVTHVENMCASGTEAFRGACYAVASGAADFALAVGVDDRDHRVLDLSLDDAAHREHAALDGFQLGVELVRDVMLGCHCLFLPISRNGR